MTERIKPTAVSQCPLEGVNIWKNPKNRFVVFELHMDADPAKRSPEYKAKLRASMPKREYMQEYELQWDTWEGLPVYLDWDQSLHGVKGMGQPDLGLPLLRGWDFGLTPACLIGQMQGERLVILREFVAFNMGVERFCENIMPQIRTAFPRWPNQERDWLDYIDPSGFGRADTDERCCAEILGEHGIICRPGATTWESRRRAVDHYLTRRTKEGFLMQVSIPGCPTLVRGFNGGYQYPEKAREIEPAKLRPVKNRYSHVHDALQMIATGAKMIREDYGQAIPAPSYSRG